MDIWKTISDMFICECLVEEQIQFFFMGEILDIMASHICGHFCMTMFLVEGLSNWGIHYC